MSLTDGVVYRMRGDVSQPADDLAAQGARLREKFDALTVPVLGKTVSTELGEMVEGIEHLKDVRAMMALTRA